MLARVRVVMQVATAALALQSVALHAQAAPMTHALVAPAPVAARRGDAGTRPSVLVASRAIAVDSGPRHRCRASELLVMTVIGVPAAAGGGALVGGIVFYAGIGALAADHGSEFQRTRRAFLRGGAAVGAAIGVGAVVQALRDGCPSPAGSPAHRSRSRQRPDDVPAPPEEADD